jgi:hypothetical protein
MCITMLLVRKSLRFLSSQLFGLAVISACLFIALPSKAQENQGFVVDKIIAKS